MFKYPKVNYIGNKEKIAQWICDQFPKDAESLFDAFSGGCSLSYEAKCRGLEVRKVRFRRKKIISFFFNKKSYDKKNAIFSI